MKIMNATKARLRSDCSFLYSCEQKIKEACLKGEYILHFGITEYDRGSEAINFAIATLESEGYLVKIHDEAIMTISW